MKKIMMLILFASFINASTAKEEMYREGFIRTECRYTNPPTYVYKRYKGVTYKQEVPKCIKYIYIGGQWHEVM